MKPTVCKRVHRFRGTHLESFDDNVAVESKVRIFVNGSETVTLSATPTNLRELVTGFLTTEEILKGDWCPEKIILEVNQKDIIANVELEGFISIESLTVNSGCLGAISFSKETKTRVNDSTSVAPSTILKLFREFQKRSTLYRETGCIHSAAVADREKILFTAEDVGRHNAVDKVVGWIALNRVSAAGKILLISGRISSDMVSKALKIKIPIILSRSAPTSLAIELAERAGITLVGFVRGERFNVYTNPERIEK